MHPMDTTILDQVAIMLKTRPLTYRSKCILLTCSKICCAEAKSFRIEVHIPMPQAAMDEFMSFRKRQYEL
ncbi:hypothetical protein AQUCO_00900043v1 [Aquilegia coerulea]|uniref:Uncharacterized protein n=1 Tax=Aquilegia coerulea TaxID=218851 RepID=A0A2G5EBM4_AQUCA|nr:hypothetical protein AQUCO_00900043v1 [Aquilegia coerulea]